MRNRGIVIAAITAFVWAALFNLVDAAPAAAFDDATRDTQLQPERVMDAIGVRPGMVIGEAGKVYADDIDESALSHVRDRCRSDGIRNVETVVGQVDDQQFPDRARPLLTRAFRKGGSNGDRDNLSPCS